MIVKEFCADELHNLEKAAQTDITRVELCSDLSIGGVSVHPAVLSRALEICKPREKGVYAMVRNRGGDFFYSQDDLKEMGDFAVLATQQSVDGLVFGPLKEVASGDGLKNSRIVVDLEAILQLKTRLLVECGYIPELVFHMAFDLINDQEHAIEELIEQGFVRILTHGTTLKEIDTEHIRRITSNASERIEIMAGGGVNFSNFEAVLKKSGADSVHGTQIVQL